MLALIAVLAVGSAEAWAKNNQIERQQNSAILDAASNSDDIGFLGSVSQLLIPGGVPAAVLGAVTSVLSRAAGNVSQDEAEKSNERLNKLVAELDMIVSSYTRKALLDAAAQAREELDGCCTDCRLIDEGPDGMRRTVFFFYIPEEGKKLPPHNPFGGSGGAYPELPTWIRAEMTEIRDKNGKLKRRRINVGGHDREEPYK